jgi:AraC family transcriptional regulator of adaptative response/methylated-DNA-[protein]-cysteine methyltransferase
MQEQALWERVLARDRSSDGQFVYGVQSTKVYCRPSCPSRRPRREYVRFFARPEAAERAGFRACRRCRPNQADAQLRYIREAVRLIEAAPDERVTLSNLSRRIGLSPFHFLRLFKKVMGVTPRQYQQARRLNRFKAGLRQGQAVADAVYEAGYGSSSRVYEKAAAHLGMTPSRYRQKGAGLHIRYAILGSRLGQVLVAATERGVCSLSFGASESELERRLRDEFSAAAVERDDNGLSEFVAMVSSFLEGHSSVLPLPLDIQATAFQLQAWEALRQIPCGETRTYSEVAAQLGYPRAVRAVARACATNPVALAIPCHRVVPKSGGVGGYRWGAKRKQALLRIEQGGQ